MTGLESNKVRALLVYLAVEADQPHSRDELIGLLWPDQPDAAARADLRQALANLRQALGDRAAEPIFLNVTPEGIQFQRASDHWIDATAFTALVADCKTHVHRRLDTCQSCARRLQQAVDLYRGDFLAQFFQSGSEAFEEWVLVKRERLHRAALDALYYLTEYHDRRAEYDQAQRYALRQLEFDPWREEAHRQLMRALALSGQRSTALAQYETCRRILANELGAEPAKETTALYEKIKSGDLEHADRRHNLPASPTPLIGRERELAEIAQLLENPMCRLVTLTGPGGIGKTRMGLAAATANAPIFADGAAFVALAGLSSANLLAETILTSLGLTLGQQSEPQKLLLAYLGQRELLLTLDNFEHLLDGVELITQIIQQAPKGTLLITSRERLALQAEQVFELEGLDYPPAAAADDIEHYSAVQLFVERARHVQRRFQLAADDASAVARICRIVEGLPLAIELAASTVGTQSCTTIANEIAAGLQTLATKYRDMPERHRSVWAAFEHSWTLLSENERYVFSRLSVFRGGFEFEAAQHVADATPQALSALIDKSLLRRDAVGRYDMHELLRQYGAQKLAQIPTESQWLHDLHCNYYAEFVQQREETLHANRQREALDEMGREIENIRAAWSWAVEQCRQSDVDKFVSGLFDFYEVRGSMAEAEAAFAKAAAVIQQPLVQGRVLARQGKACLALSMIAKGEQLLRTSASILRDLPDQKETALALNFLGDAAHLLGRDAEAERLHQESLAISREIGDRLNNMRALDYLGLLAYTQGEYSKAEQFWQEGLAMCEESGNPRAIALMLINLGSVAHQRREYVRAREIYEHALDNFTNTGDQWGIADCLNNLGSVARALGDYAEAGQFYRQGLTIRQQIGHRWGVGFALIQLGRTDEMLGQHIRARDLYLDGLMIAHETGHQWGTLIALVNLGSVSSALGEYQAARKYFGEALEMSVEAKAVPFVLDTLIGIASLLARTNDQKRALTLLGFALHHPMLRHDTLARAEQLMATTFAEVVCAETDAWAQGRGLSLEQAVAHALATTGPVE